MRDERKNDSTSTFLLCHELKLISSNSNIPKLNFDILKLIHPTTTFQSSYHLTPIFQSSPHLIYFKSPSYTIFKARNNSRRSFGPLEKWLLPNEMKVKGWMVIWTLRKTKPSVTWVYLGRSAAVPALARFMPVFSPASLFSSRGGDPCFHHRVIVGMKQRDSFSKRLVELHFFQPRHSLVICVWRKDGKLALMLKGERRYSHATLGYTKKPSFFFVRDQFDDNNDDDATTFTTEKDSPENFLTNSVHFSKCRIHFTAEKYVWFITLLKKIFFSYVIINSQSANYD